MEEEGKGGGGGGGRGRRGGGRGRREVVKETVSKSQKSLLTLEQGEEKDSGIATRHTGLGELCVVVTLLTWLNERKEGQHIVRERQHVRDGTLACMEAYDQPQGRCHMIRNTWLPIGARVME